MSWRIRNVDPDAQAYILAVEQADGQSLEADVQFAINRFVVGCKADGIWDAIKASCIMAGARTLQGALVPLKGTAPTNFNFVDGDYNRKTGLVGNGSTKYLDSNRAHNIDGQNDRHLAVSAQAGFEATTLSYLAGANTFGTGPGQSYTTIQQSFGMARFTAAGASTQFSRSNPAPTFGGLYGVTRANSSQITTRVGGSNEIFASTSTTLHSNNYIVFARNSEGVLNSPTTARLYFYSIGEAIDLALLDARVTALINEYGALDI